MAKVISGTGIAVAAGVVVVHINTPTAWITRIGRTRIVVITNQCGSAHTRAARADVVGGAGISVITRRRIVGIHAARLWVAGVIGATVVVVAGDCGTSYAGAAATRIIGGTGVAVVTCGCVIGKGTTRRRSTPIVGADIVVVAHKCRPAQTGPVGATVIGGAGIAVITCGCVGSMCTSQRR